MYRVKVFSPNENGKIEFTKREIERLLQEIYSEGYKDGTQSKWTISYGGTTGNELYGINTKYITKDDAIGTFCNNSVTCGTDTKLSNSTATTTHTVPAKLEYGIKDNITTDINHPNNLNTILTKVIG